MILVLYEYYDDVAKEWVRDWEIGNQLSQIVYHLNQSYSKRTIRNVKGFEGTMIPIDVKLDLKEIL